MGVSVEVEESERIYGLDAGFREVKAKAYTGYNTAWKYHCAYDDVYGPELGQFDHVHPAYLD